MRRGKRRPDYEYIRAWGRFRSYPQDVIEQQVFAARLQGAPQRVVHYDVIGGKWYTLDDLAPDVYDCIVLEYERRHAVARAARAAAREQTEHVDTE